MRPAHLNWIKYRIFCNFLPNPSSCVLLLRQRDWYQHFYIKVYNSIFYLINCTATAPCITQLFLLMTGQRRTLEPRSAAHRIHIQIKCLEIASARTIAGTLTFPLLYLSSARCKFTAISLPSHDTPTWSTDLDGVIPNVVFKLQLPSATAICLWFASQPIRIYSWYTLF